jgi:hypothetical protein
VEEGDVVCSDGVSDRSGEKSELVYSGVEHVSDGGPDVDGVVGCGE